MIQESIPYSGTKGVSRLFATYVTDYDRLAPYYTGDWREDRSYEAVAQSLTAGPIDRSVLVDVLEEQNLGWNNGRRASQLRDPRSLAVVTGQQVGIFGGPLYTLYKALTTIRLAERLSRKLSRPVVPVFWIEGADHDLDEVKGVAVPGKQIWYDGHKQPETGNLGSVGDLVFGKDIDRVIAELREALPDTSFREDIFATHYAAYGQGVTFADAFAHTLSSLLGSGSMVFMNPEDCRLKQLVAPLLRRELSEYTATHAALKATSKELEKDYHAQVHVNPGNVFMLGNSGREALDPTGKGYRARFSGNMIPLDGIADIPPCSLSPNVVMRPLVQDSLLPTVAYVAGPGEIAYFAQFKSLYSWAKRPMPVIYPRASLTIVEPRVAKLMKQHELEVDELRYQTSELMRRCVLEGTELERSFEKAAIVLDAGVEGLRPAVTAVDPTLRPTVEAMRAQWGKELSKLQRRAERAEKRRHEQTRAQIEYCKQALYPNGSFQERVLPALYYLVKYGEDFLDQVRSGLDIELTSQHQLLALS
ncbi:MAG: bacillithiol biosynthesis cysteine-adding enzyme BshC [Bacteroidetes bacterium]|nr:bacillithiol biosynthesis cysteine-adding enzyme BshC [Bacteroidota bacterium]MDE2672716.1 bacillithiol biosynthesis cysteine-adding enzyme BshC [Bacteroidota bacterium]